MQTPYKRATVYDLETGGFNCLYNSITEMAMVTVDMQTLKIIDEFSVLLKPRVDLSWMTDEAIKDMKIIFKNIALKDDDTGIKTVIYKGKKITLKNISDLEEDANLFKSHISNTYPNNILYLKAILQLEQCPIHKHMFKLYFNNCYNPEALAITKISVDLLEKEGVEYEEAYKLISDQIKKHTVGNSKPIMVGHNIGTLPRRIIKGKEVEPDGFDNPFMEKFFKDNGDDWFYRINDKIIDTLKEARMKWYELTGYSLGVCANEVGLTLKEAHRALPDTIANANFFIKLMKALRGDGSTKKKYERRKFTANF